MFIKGPTNDPLVTQQVMDALTVIVIKQQKKRIATIYILHRTAAHGQEKL